MAIINSGDQSLIFTNCINYTVTVYAQSFVANKYSSAVS